MANALTNLTDFIIKPSASFAAGVVLFGVVWGFFKGVESVLNDDTKLEIAVWLLGVKVGQRLEPWPDTFAKVFDRVFGKKHVSWTCFLRSSIASLVVILSLAFAILAVPPNPAVYPPPSKERSLLYWLIAAPFAGMIPDYFALLSTRIILKQMTKTARTLIWVTLMVIDAYVTLLIAHFSSEVIGLLVIEVEANVFSNPKAWIAILMDVGATIPSALLRYLRFSVLDLRRLFGFLPLFDVNKIPSGNSMFSYPSLIRFLSEKCNWS